MEASHIGYLVVVIPGESIEEFVRLDMSNVEEPAQERDPQLTACQWAPGESPLEF